MTQFFVREGESRPRASFASEVVCRDLCRDDATVRNPVKDQQKACRMLKKKKKKKKRKKKKKGVLRARDDNVNPIIWFMLKRFLLCFRLPYSQRKETETERDDGEIRLFKCESL